MKQPGEKREREKERNKRLCKDELKLIYRYVNDKF